MILRFVCSVLFSDSLFLFDFVLVFILNITSALVPVFVAVTLHRAEVVKANEIGWAIQNSEQGRREMKTAVQGGDECQGCFVTAR